MVARRLLLFTAVLLLLATLAAGVAPQRPLPPPPASTIPADPGEPRTVERRISADASGGTTVRVDRGEILELEVSGRVLDSVLLEGLDRMDAIEPRTPARYNVLAEHPGTYPIRLVAADRRIGRLVITQ